MGIQSYGDTALDYYNLRLMGGTAFNPEQPAWRRLLDRASTNYSPRVQALLGTSRCPTGSFANGRRFWSCRQSRQ